MYDFEEIVYEQIDKEEFDKYSRKSIFTTKEWLDFIIKDSNVKPLIFRITKNKEFKGYIPFMITKKMGVKIAGSPFRGWSTCWMGVEVESISEKIAIILEIKEILFKKYKCLYCEIVDRDIQEEEIRINELKYHKCETLELEINKTDEQLWKNFKTDCRNYIRQFEKRGAILEEVEPTDEFAEEYYLELIDVFAKQGMLPTYTLDKVKKLLSSLKDTGNILCLHVITPDNKPAASSIFVADKEKFFFWGGASYREHQHYRPNEYMIWYAIKYWREHGRIKFDMVGNRPYKRKFGPIIQEYYCITIAKYSVILKLRNLAEKMYFKMLTIKGKKSKKN